jgi:hypothetical protein
MRNGTLIAGLLTGLVVVGCHGNYPGTGPERYYEPPRALAPAFAAPGSEWSYVRKDSGSYGDGSSQVTWKSLPMQNYQGHPHYAYEGPEATLLIEPRSGSYAAQLKGGKLDVSWDPPLNFYHWPVWVGESWSTPYKVTNHATNQTKEMRAWYTIEEQQTVHVPAGSFRLSGPCTPPIRSGPHLVEPRAWYHGEEQARAHLVRPGRSRRARERAAAPEPQVGEGIRAPAVGSRCAIEFA